MEKRDEPPRPDWSAKARRKSYVKVTLFSVQTWVNLRILKQKRLFKKKSLGIVFIKFKLVRRRGIEPRTLGLRGPWYSAILSQNLVKPAFKVC